MASEEEDDERKPSVVKVRTEIIFKKRKEKKKLSQPTILWRLIKFRLKMTNDRGNVRRHRRATLI